LCFEFLIIKSPCGWRTAGSAEEGGPEGGVSCVAGKSVSSGSRKRFCFGDVNEQMVVTFRTRLIRALFREPCWKVASGCVLSMLAHICVALRHQKQGVTVIPKKQYSTFRSTCDDIV